MNFVGPVNRLGDTLVRPHHIRVRLGPDGSTSKATVEHLSYLGFEVRADLCLEDGRKVWVHTTREETKRLGLERARPYTSA